MRPTLIGPLLSCASAEAAIIRAASAAARERAGKGCIERAPGNRGKAGWMSRRGQTPAAGTLKTAKSLLRRVAPQGGFRQWAVCRGRPRGPIVVSPETRPQLFDIGKRRFDRPDRKSVV